MAKWDILKYLRTSNSHVVWLAHQRIKNTAEGTIHFFRSLLEKEVLPLLQKQKGFRDEISLVASNGSEGVGISLWDHKEDAEAYNRTTYPEVQKLLAKVSEGTPQVQTYEVGTSTIHKTAARGAGV